jgi:preprotein translocase subunit SecB
MRKSKKTRPAEDHAVASEGQQQIQAKIVSQYIKDLSFENPNFRKLITSPGDQPNLKVEVNVGAQRIENDLYEAAIEFKATASNNLGTIYVLETVYAGLLKIESIPAQAQRLTLCFADGQTPTAWQLQCQRSLFDEKAKKTF